MTDHAVTDVETRLAALEDRLRALEDEREITRLILSYGPLVDSGCAEAVAALWDEDGVYDVDELMMDGRPAIDAMVRSANHRRWIAGGCAHFVGPPHVTVAGIPARPVSLPAHSFPALEMDPPRHGAWRGSCKATRRRRCASASGCSRTASGPSSRRQWRGRPGCSSSACALKKRERYCEG